MQTPTTIYLDHAATTPLRPEARTAMEPFLAGSFANASSLYAAAREARKAIDEARDTIAAATGARPEEIVFTGSGTEADNLALKGAAWHALPQGRDGIVVGATEHEAVSRTAQWLAGTGFRSTTIGVDGDGVLDLEALRAAVDRRTAVVSVMWANNEVGTIQPVSEIAAIAGEAGARFHTDAVQAFRYLPVQAAAADLASLSAHKIGGPKGVGALIVRRGVSIVPLLHGGGQERGVRSSTYNPAGVAAFGAAVAATVEERERASSRVRALRDRLQERLLSAVSGVQVNGAGADRLPGHLNVSIAGVEGEPLILLLDAAGIAVSSGSACTSGSSEPSHVLLAMGVPASLATGSLRFTLGPETAERELDDAVTAVRAAVERLRR